MKKVIVMLSLGVLFAGSSMALDLPRGESKAHVEQRGEKRERLSPEQMASKRTERMSKQLSLSKKQERQLQALHLKQAQQMQALHKKDSRSDRGREEGRKQQFSKEQQAQMKAMRSRYESELKDILSPSQFKKYAAERQAMRDRHQDGRGKFQGPRKARS